jgi:glycosyltransferase involved in cell wall biosynthesis
MFVPSVVLAERLIVLERMPHRQLYPVIAGAHLVVLPSLIENLPNACLEAMGLGKVVIGTSGTGFDELISEERRDFLFRLTTLKAGRKDHLCMDQSEAGRTKVRQARQKRRSFHRSEPSRHS